MMTESFKGFGRASGAMVALAIVLVTALMAPAAAWAQQPEPAAPAAQAAAPEGERRGGEANLVLPDLSQVTVGGYDGRTLLMIGLGVSALGILFGLVILNQLKNLPVHRSMREISELIYETCKTYLVTQGKFLAILEIFIAVIIVLYFGVLEGMAFGRVADHPAVQRRRHSRQLQRGVVRHPREHLRELADGVRQPRRQAVPGLRDSAQGRA